MIQDSFQDQKTRDSVEWNLLIKELESRCQSSLGRHFVEELKPGYEEQYLLDLRAQAVLELSTLNKSTGLKLPLGAMGSLDSVLNRIERSGQLLEEEFSSLVNAQKIVRDLIFFLARFGKEAPRLKKELAALSALEEWTSKHFKLLDLSGRFADEASPDLKALRKLKERLEHNVRNSLESRLKDPLQKNLLQDKYVTLRDGRYVLPVRSNFKGQLNGIIHDVSKTEQTHFVEPQEVVELNNKIKITEREIELEIEKLLRQIVLETKPFVDLFRANLESIALGDFFQASADVIRSWHSEKVCVATWKEGPVKFETLSHPLLSLNQKVVPHTLAWKQAFVLTGPNTGGKTVLMKNIALSYLMARSGLPVAAQSLSFPESVRKIFIDIGDDQSLMEHLSTFSSHLKSYKYILDEAQEGDLVFIDEIATGTDPEEGAHLARAILEELLERGVFAFLTTHYKALKTFAMSDSRCRIAAMAYDQEKRRPTYELTMDFPGSSSALDAAERWGLPESVLKRARSYQGDEDGSMQGALEGLKRLQKSLEKEKESLQDALNAAQSREKAAEQLRLRYQKSLKEKVALESQELLKEFQQAKKDLKEKISGLELQASEKKSQALFQEIAKETDSLKDLIRDKSSAPAQTLVGKKANWEDLKKGHLVEIKGLGAAQIEELPKSLKEDALIRVKVGVLSTRVPLDRVYLPKASTLKSHQMQKEAQMKRSQVQTFMQAPSDSEKTSSSNICDVRGKAVASAMKMVERALNDLLRGQFNSLTIIHGHGTGSLKNKLRTYLEQERKDVSFRKGAWPGEGGDGVSIVELA